MIGFAMSPAVAATLSCPLTSPVGWGMPQTRLETVSVVSYPAKEPIAQDDTRWGMVPEKQTTKNGKLYQSWTMNFDAPNFVFKVDCIYFETKRFVRLDAAHVSRCEAIWTLQKGQVVPGSVVFRCD